MGVVSVVIVMIVRVREEIPFSLFRLCSVSQGAFEVFAFVRFVAIL
jgi:hypothetical protein